MSLEREELDEHAAACRDVARMTKAQFDAFVEAGFTPGQALKLTIAWLQEQLPGG